LLNLLPLGSNLQALIDAQPTFPYSATIVLVLSNRKAAYGLQRAASASPPIPTSYLALQPYLKSNPDKTRDDYDAEIARRVLEAKPDLVVLAGWMHVFGDGFLDILNGMVDGGIPDHEGLVRPVPVINLHPALPGEYDGAHALDRAWEDYQAAKIVRTGVMVHRVVKQVDAGQPILTREIPFRGGESKEEFETRLHGVEWDVIVQATKEVLEQRVQQLRGSASES